MKQKSLSYLVFAIPVTLIFFISVIIPAVLGMVLSFSDWNGIIDTIAFSGFENFKHVFSSDSDFYTSFLFTFKFAMVIVVGANTLGLALALLVTQRFRGHLLYRGIFFMPNLIGGILLGFTWQFIFTSVFEDFARKWGIGFLSGWLSTPATGFWGLVIITIWQLSGYLMIIYIAGIESIPKSLFEAATIDGSSAIQRIRHIMIPMLAPSFTVGLFLTLSNAFKIFDTNLALTDGGPYKSTEMLALNIYHTAFILNRFGLAQAKAVIYLIIVAGISILQLRWSKGKEVQL